MSCETTQIQNRIIDNICKPKVNLNHEDLKMNLFNKLNCTVALYFMFIIVHFVNKLLYFSD